MSSHRRIRDRRISDALILGLVVLLVGCVPGLPQGAPREPDREVPESFAGVQSDGNTARVDWNEFFADPHLVALIETALENNQELNIAIQENFIANYEVMARRGEIFPRLGVGVDAGIERVSESSSQGASDELAGLDEHLQDYSFGFYASWEIDVWGRLKDRANASAYRYLASVEGRHFMVTQIVAEIASLYYELMALDQQLDVVRRSIELQQDAVDIVRLQWQAAQTTSVAITRFEAALLGFRTREVEIQQRIVETENRINFLAGRFPQRVARSSDQFMELQPQGIVAGLPGELLANRPDIRAAELRMQAAQLDVSAARARFFPSLSLEAGIGYGSFDILRLLDTPGSLFYNLFAGITAPLLNRTGITADYFSADARQRQAVISYERTILNAFIEVVNRLNLINNLAQSYDLAEQRVQRLHESVEISNRLFNSARADYLEVLTARREALDAELELIETKQRQMTAIVRLYQALGGGWRGDEASAGGEAPAAGEGQ